MLTTTTRTPGAWRRAGDGYDAPHHLRVFVRGRDVTNDLGDLRDFVRSLPKHGRRHADRHVQFVVAASSVKNLMAIMNDTRELTNAPGPNGLEGGYPIRLGHDGAEVVPPQGMSVAEARQLNLQAHVYDGVQEIRDDGSVVMAPESFETFRELFGIDSDTVHIETAFEQAMDLRNRSVSSRVATG